MDPTGADRVGDLERTLREEVERVRRAERAAEAALEELRGARRRLEALVGRAMAARERPAPAPGPAPGPEASSPRSPADGRVVKIAGAALLVLVAAVAAVWLVGEGGLPDIDPGDALVVRGPEDGSLAAEDGASLPGDDASPGAPDDPPAGDGAETAAPAGDATWARPLPPSAEERAALYDSLWAARSPVFNPLVGRLAEATDHEGVAEAVEAWRDGEDLDPLSADRLHSALLQLVLRLELGVALSLDGQMLRNPCRGSSCTALLRLWEEHGSRFGLPEIPEDVARRPTRLALAEKAVLLTVLREEGLGARSSTSRGG